MPFHTCALGIDIGTSGVKALALRRDGHVMAIGSRPLPPLVSSGYKREQEPELWWRATVLVIQNILRQLLKAGQHPKGIRAIAVDGTSGTIVPVDAELNPLRPAIMYNDARSVDQAARLNETGRSTIVNLGYRFNASFGLAKILWLHENEPKTVENAAWLLHQTDFITARLCRGSSRMDIRPSSDESNALKSGYDFLKARWPPYLSHIGIEVTKLPQVCPMGQTIGTLEKGVAERLGLSPSCVVVAGLTDGTAACVASGARKVGDMNTTMGTTVVWKTLASSLIRDPEGRLYSHKHPGGCFLPGGASNSGGGAISAHVAADSRNPIDRMARLAEGLVKSSPSRIITYPLPSRGERFPFVDPDFEPFSTGDPNDKPTLYRSCLEGIACIERWGYEVASHLGAACDGEVWTTGKGAYIDPWMQIRADFLNRPVCRAAYPESVFGAALVAAMNIWYEGSWEDTASRFITESHRCEPAAKIRRACDEQYDRFRKICDSRILNRDK